MTGAGQARDAAPRELRELPFFAEPAHPGANYPPAEPEARAQAAFLAPSRTDPGALPGWLPGPGAQQHQSPAGPGRPAGMPGPDAGHGTGRDEEHIDWDLVSRLRATVSNLLTEALGADPGMSEKAQRAAAQAHISEVIREHADERLRSGGQLAAWSPAMRSKLARAVFDALFRLGRIQPLVDDPRVENIDIYGYDNVWVSRSDGSRERSEPIARSDAELIADIAFLARRGGEDGRSFTPSDPILDMDLPGGARLAAVHPPISPRPKVVIRVHRLVDISLDELAHERGTLSAAAAAFLAAAVRAGVSIVVAGSPGAGKTTLVRALANCIPPEEEIVTIEKERELHLDRMGDRHLIVTPLQYRPGQGEATASGRRPGEVTLVDLLEESLRLNAERIIVGEVRGGEVDAMFQAMQAGAGSLSTLHANSPADAIERLAGLTLKALGTSDAYAYRQIAQHIGLIVQIAKERDPDDGTIARRVTRIAQVQPGERGPDGFMRPIAADIFRSPGPGMPAAPSALPAGGLLELLELHGFDAAMLGTTEGAQHP